MTRIKDPKQVASTIRQILFILITSSSAGFMALSCLREPGCPGGAPRAQEPGPRGAERSPGGVGQDEAGLVRRIGLASRPLSEPQAPGGGVEDAGVALEVRRCLDQPAARSGSSCCSSSPLRRRLRSRRPPLLPPRGPGGRGASGDGGAAAAAAAVLVAVAVGRVPSLLSKGYFIALQ